MAGLRGIIYLSNSKKNLPRQNNNVGGGRMGFYEQDYFFMLNNQELKFCNNFDFKTSFFAYLSSFKLDNKTNSGSYFIDNDFPISVIVDGELYNTKSLVNEIGIDNVNASVAEIIAKGFYHFNDKIFCKLNGKFSICILNKKTNTYYLVRDRGGVKNIFYSIVNNDLIFGTNIKSLLVGGLVKSDVDIQGLWNAISFPCPPQPQTIFKNIKALERGSYIKISADKSVEINSYWDIPLDIENISLTNKQSADMLENSLKKSIEYQMQTGNCFGTLLSGGVDSPLISALASMYESNLTALTMGLSDPVLAHKNEDQRASLTANMYNMNHVVKLFSVEDLFKFLDEMVEIYEQPGISLASNYFLAKIANDENVKILFNGLAADELHGGFHYFKFLKIWRNLLPIKKIIQYAPNGISPKLDAFASMFFAKDIAEYYTQGFSVIKENEKRKLMPGVLARDSFNSIKKYYNADIKNKNDVSALMYFMFANCPNHHLYRFEQFTQHFGVQARYPFLDNDVINTSFKIPYHLKVKNDIRKITLKNVAKKYIAEESLGKNKIGFSLPIQYWINNELKDFTLDTLNMLKKRDYFSVEAIDQIYKTYHNKSGAKVWKLVMLELWFQKFIDV